MSFLPKSRTQEYQNNNDGTQTIRCYSPINPHYYKDSDGNFVSAPMEDLYPFLPRDEFKANMIVKCVDE